MLTSLSEDLGASAKHNPAELLPILIVAIDDDGDRWVFGNIAQALERGAAGPFRLLVDGDVKRIPFYREAHRHDMGNCATISGREMTNPLLGEKSTLGIRWRHTRWLIPQVFRNQTRFLQVPATTQRWGYGAPLGAVVVGGVVYVDRLLSHLPAVSAALVMDCPVCLKDAKDASPPTYLGLVVECPRCGLYRVTQIAITALRSLKPEERIAALDMAKTVGSRGAPTVTSASFNASRSRKSLGRTQPPPHYLRR